MAVVIDIETRAALSDEMRGKMVLGIEVPKNLKDPEKLKAKVAEKAQAIVERAALSPLTGEVACVAIGDSASGQIESKTAIDGELEVLRWLDNKLYMAAQPIIVTYNGSRFDIPFLAGRIMISGVEMTYRLPAPRDRSRHIDLYYMLGEFGPLDEWMVALGLGAKHTPSREIPGLCDAGRWDLVEEHCRQDVAATLDLFARLRRVMLLH